MNNAPPRVVLLPIPLRSITVLRWMRMCNKKHLNPLCTTPLRKIGNQYPPMKWASMDIVSMCRTCLGKDNKQQLWDSPLTKGLIYYWDQNGCNAPHPLQSCPTGHHCRLRLPRHSRHHVRPTAGVPRAAGDCNRPIPVFREHRPKLLPTEPLIWRSSAYKKLRKVGEPNRPCTKHGKPWCG